MKSNHTFCLLDTRSNLPWHITIGPSKFMVIFSDRDKLSLFLKSDKIPHEKFNPNEQIGLSQQVNEHLEALTCSNDFGLRLHFSDCDVLALDPIRIDSFGYQFTEVTKAEDGKIKFTPTKILYASDPY